MFVLVSHGVDIHNAEGEKRLHRVTKVCKNYDQRVQCSVFECIVDPAQWVVFKDSLIDVIDDGKDSLRFPYLGSNWG